MITTKLINKEDDACKFITQEGKEKYIASYGTAKETIKL